MTREDIIGWMQEVGAKKGHAIPKTYDGFVDIFQHFAALVAAHEREACAKVCDEVVRDLYIVDGDASEEVRRCAKTIRKRRGVKP